MEERWLDDGGMCSDQVSCHALPSEFPRAPVMGQPLLWATYISLVLFGL